MVRRAEPAARPPGSWMLPMDPWLTVATGDNFSLSSETMSDDKRDLLSLDVTGITNVLVHPGSLWREVRVVDETGSTNADLLARAGAGAAAVRAATGVEAGLKWPNDVLAAGGKLGGILAERSGSVVVVGIGINVWQDRAGLPGAAATSVLLEAAGGDGGAAEVPGLREPLLAELLGALSRWYLAWRDQASPGDADACGLRREYARRCTTLGHEVVVTMPGAEAITGTATGVDWAGRLKVRTEHGLVSVTAGDVVHVRPRDPGK